MNSQKAPIIKSYEMLMAELNQEERRNKSMEGIGMAVIIAIGMLVAALGLVGAWFCC